MGLENVFIVVSYFIVMNSKCGDRNAEVLDALLFSGGYGPGEPYMPDVNFGGIRIGPDKVDSCL